MTNNKGETHQTVVYAAKCNHGRVCVVSNMRAGREDRARSLYESLVDSHTREYVQPFVLALRATAVGEHEAAIRFCEAAIEERDMLFALQPMVAGLRACSR